jgi:predicted DNA-binding transcriptional regulator AlpA
MGLEEHAANKTGLRCHRVAPVQSLLGNERKSVPGFRKDWPTICCMEKHRPFRTAPIPPQLRLVTEITVETNGKHVSYLNTKHAAAYLGISESWLRQRRMTGNLGGQRPGPPFVRLGRAVRYSKPALDHWLGTQSPGSSVLDVCDEDH